MIMNETIIVIVAMIIRMMIIIMIILMRTMRIIINFVKLQKVHVHVRRRTFFTYEYDPSPFIPQKFVVGF